MDAMKILGVDAVGVGDRDLRYGYAWLKSQVKRASTPIVCANLVDKSTKKTAFPPMLISKKVPNLKVGFFSLISDKVDLGPGRDSLSVEDPHAAARRAIADLRKQGATVVVLLSQLGKVESEDLVTAVDGLDAVIVGRNVSLLQKGRLIKNTILTYGGERGQYMGRTVLSLDKSRKVVASESDTYMLGPEVGERADILALVKSFEDAFNEKMRRQEKETAAQTQSVKNQEGQDHFLGSELCIRCHAEEGAQWKTTSHSVAWQTLINAKKDATPECIGCHVVGYNQPGGFVSATSTPNMSNVQCENCHGMGTRHEAFPSSTRAVTAQVCITCHQGENDPEFNWEKKLPMIAHDNLSGQTIKNKKQKPDGTTMMKGSGSGSGH